ncbi:MAG: tRNA uridine-5-carboxymethylaminomethyl(34) synthesis GTPase MnmE [Candidatus Scalindua sp.]|nr:tRNA uridine-5-carboxymethylaminomethyl(34) synthesis GTPase MnmE [Candidatus Scalindua sp.]MCR4344459.1 tRNA uridine-5-carboxymethylaminomethyl(34) synthesis GTPase MnmE [Candidatus Scalindua sp.]
MSFGLNDCILAISTPSGQSLRAIIRLSGKDVFNYLRSLFAPEAIREIVCEKGFRSYHSNLYLEKEQVSIPASIYIMKSPNSYTREDIVEIHTFGSPPLLEMLMETLLSPGRESTYKEDNIEVTRGIRIAEPGEFTKRAFLNGRISLAEAESVMHVIRSQTDSELLMSVANLKGKLTGLMHKIQEKLVNLCARTEAAIDFYDQDIELISSGEIKKELEQVKERLCMVGMDGQKPIISHYGVKTVFIGLPNAGKSSLFNKLLDRSKAIVTQVRGTTRDTLEADMVLEGVNLRIKDTAGVAWGSGELESLAVQRTYGAMDDAQIVLFVVDGSVQLCSRQIELFNSITTRSKITVINKTDLKQNVCYENLPSQMNAFPVVNTSVLTGEGLDRLKKTIVSEILESNVDISASDIVFTMRQKVVIGKALDIIGQISDSLAGGIGHELIAMDLRRAIDTIGEVTGEVVTDDILDIVFSTFCVGK